MSSGDGVPRVGLRKREAAAAVGMSVRLLERLMARGQLRFWRVGRLVLFSVEHLVEDLDRLYLVTGNSRSPIADCRGEGKSEGRRPKSEGNPKAEIREEGAGERHGGRGKC